MARDPIGNRTKPCSQGKWVGKDPNLAFPGFNSPQMFSAQVLRLWSLQGPLNSRPLIPISGDGEWGREGGSKSLRLSRYSRSQDEGQTWL